MNMTTVQSIMELFKNDLFHGNGELYRPSERPRYGYTKIQDVGDIFTTDLNISTKENLKTVYSMDKGSLNIQMGKFMKVLLKIMLVLDKEPYIMRMEI